MKATTPDSAAEPLAGNEQAPNAATASAWRTFNELLTRIEQALIAADDTSLAHLLKQLYQQLFSHLLPASQACPGDIEASVSQALSALQEHIQEIDDDKQLNEAQQAERLLALQVRLSALLPLSLALNEQNWDLYQDIQQHLEALARANTHAPIAPSARAQQRHRLAAIQDELLSQRIQRYIKRTQTLLEQTQDLQAQNTQQAAEVTSLWDRVRYGEQLTTRVREQLTRIHSKEAVTELILPSSSGSARQGLPLALANMDKLQRQAIAHIIALVKSMPVAQARQWLSERQEDLFDFADQARNQNDQLSLAIQVYDLQRAHAFLQGFRCALLEDDEYRTAVAYKRLLRIERRIKSQWVDKSVSSRLALRFGEHAEKRLDVTVLLMVSLAIVLLVVDLGMTLDSVQQRRLIYVDIGICLALLGDFGLRIAQAPDWRNYLRRHWFTDLLPAIPFSGLALWIDAVTAQAEGTTLIRGLRVANVYLKKARPVIRLGRIFIFAIRGMDRLVNMHRHLLNWDIEFYHSSRWSNRQQLLLQARRTRYILQKKRDSLLRKMPAGTREDASRMDHAYLRAQALAIAQLKHPPLWPIPNDKATNTAHYSDKTRTVKVEWVIENLLSADASVIGETFGGDFAPRLQRLSWLAAIPPLRWLPLFSDLLQARRHTADEQSFAENAAKRIGDRLRWLNEQMLFFSDLQGVVTAPQLVDRIGLTLIESMRRPRNRLLLLGLGFALMTLLIEVLPFEWLEATATWLRRTLAWPVLFFGLIALLAVWIGDQLRRMAQTNTDFFARVAEARSISQLHATKQAHAEADQNLFWKRVIEPERRLRRAPSTTTPRLDASLGVIDNFRVMIRHGLELREGNGVGALPERIFLLYSDYLRGAPFHRSDTSISDQLLGDPALQHLRNALSEFDQHLHDDLKALDLNNRALSRSVLWQRMITQAITQRTGQLVDEYNRHALPLPQREDMAGQPEKLRRFQAWLKRKKGRIANTERTEEEVEKQDHYVTTAFTALDFLSNDPARQAAIEKRFGGEIADLAAHDRRRMIREVFGAPLDQPPIRLSFNPYKIYQRYLSAGRVFLLPFTLIGVAWRLLIAAVRWMIATLQDLKNPKARPLADERMIDNNYPIAVRKIHRMCKHLFLGAAKLRAMFDIEYLGLRIPGEQHTLPSGETLLGDLDLINASTLERQPYTHIRRRSQKALGELSGYFSDQDDGEQWLGRRIQKHCPELAAERYGEAKRALIIAYLTNFLGLRDLVQGERRLGQLVRQAVQFKGRLPRATSLWQRIALRLPPNRAERESIDRFRHWWRIKGRERLSKDIKPERALRYVERWVRSDVKGFARRIAVLTMHSNVERQIDALVEQVICEHSNWTEQLVILRAVQTLTILDMNAKERLIRNLGEYEDSGEKHEAVCVKTL